MDGEYQLQISKEMKEMILKQARIQVNLHNLVINNSTPSQIIRKNFNYSIIANWVLI